MRLLDERAQVCDAIKRFPAMYGKKSYGADTRGRNAGAELLQLDPETASGDQVNEIIGNTSWVCPQTCDECGQETWDIVEIGEPPDYESSTARVCKGCLEKALKLASGK